MSDLARKPQSRTSQHMLAPAAYSESMMPALRLARSSRVARRIAQVLLVGLGAAIILMAFAPWQQSVTGSGNVVAYAPLERRQTIEVRIKGRVIRWGEGLVENARVNKGQFLAEIQDLDADYFGRLQDQLRNNEQQFAAAADQLRASERALEASRTIVESFEAQRVAYVRVKEETIAAQDAYVEMAEKKVRAEEQQLAEYRAALPQLEAEYRRMKTLQTEGNLALQKLQEIERKLSEANAKVNRAEAYVAAAKAELEGKRREREAKDRKRRSTSTTPSQTCARPPVMFRKRKATSPSPSRN